MKRNILIIFFLTSQSVVAFSQYMDKDNTELVTRKARFIIDRYEGLLNTLSYSKLEYNQINYLIEYNSSNKRDAIFSSITKVDNDIDPSSTIETFIDVRTYLRDFHSFYTKSSNNTVTFSNIKIGKIYLKCLDKEKGRHTYVTRVEYDSYFDGKYKTGKKYERYKNIRKVAEVHIKWNGIDWELRIMDIIRYDNEKEQKNINILEALIPLDCNKQELKTDLVENIEKQFKKLNNRKNYEGDAKEALTELSKISTDKTKITIINEDKRYEYNLNQYLEVLTQVGDKNINVEIQSVDIAYPEGMKKLDNGDWEVISVKQEDLIKNTSKDIDLSNKIIIKNPDKKEKVINVVVKLKYKK